MRNDTTDWKSKVQGVFKTCQSEIKKTTDIGKKMLAASKTNSQLHEAYEELGQLLAEEMDKKKIEFKDEKVEGRASELVAQIKACHNDLEVIESEVQEIKKSE